MTTTTLIHGVTHATVGKTSTRYLSDGTRYTTRDITIRHNDGALCITLFADDPALLRLINVEPAATPVAEAA